MTLTEGDLIRAIGTGVFHIPFVKDPDGDDSHPTVRLLLTGYNRRAECC